MALQVSVRSHNATVLDNLCPGDLVEFNRGMYSHWAVYKGDGQVIHLSGDQNDGANAFNSGSCFTICGQRFSKAFVKVDNFWDVALGCKANQNNSKDKDQSPRPADEILRDALGRIGEIGYNVMWSNCEHFAKLCRYGVPSSQQVEDAAVRTGMIAGIGLLAGVAIGYFFGGADNENEEEEDMVAA